MSIGAYRRPLFRRPHMWIKDNQIYLRCDYTDKDRAKEIPGYRWNKEQKCWVYPLSVEVIRQIYARFEPETLPDTATVIDFMLAQADRAQKAKLEGWKNAQPLEPMPIKVQPFNHQVLGYNIGISLPHAAILAEMGCGKSLIALATAGRRYLDGQIKKLLIVCPTSIMFVWHDEFEKFADFPYSLLVLGGPVKKRIERLQEFRGKGLLVSVINYESVWRIEDDLRKWGPDMIIADESQRIKTPSAQQSKAMHRLSKTAKYRMILTGTPVTQGPLDFFSQYKFLDPTIFGNSYYAFRARYCNTPDAPVWMADLTFKPIGEIKPGDQVIGWQHLYGSRRFAIATVEKVMHRIANNVVKITMESGRIIKCTDDHLWLSPYHAGNKNDIWTCPRYHTSKRPRALSRIIDPPPVLSEELQREANWLAGIYDGEGSSKQIAQSREHNPEICQRIERVLNQLGIQWNYVNGKYEIKGGLQTYVNLANWLPVTKNDFKELVLGSRWSWYQYKERRPAQMKRIIDHIVKIEPLPPQEVVSLQTSTGNYIVWGYASKNCIMGGYENHQVVAYQNLPELIEKAHSIAFRVTKAEALDLPEQIDQIRYCELEPKAARIYEQMRKECIAELENEKVVTAANVLSKLLRLQQITGGFLGDGEGGIQKVSTAKLEVLREILEDIVIDNGKKVVVFARFRPEIAAIEKLLQELKIRYECITGDVDMSDRGEKVHSFQNDADVKVFVAQLQTAGLGITLTAADTAVFYSLDFSFANYDQAKARLHRISQKNNVTNIHIIVKGTVDVKVMRALAAKKNLADEVVDGWRKVFEFKEE